MIVVDLGVSEGHNCIFDVNTSALRQKIRREGSGKLPSTGRWRKVPGNVQMLGSHSTRGIRVNFAILKLDRAGSVDVNTSSLQHQIPQVNSRKLPSTGRWGNVPGKVQIWRQSHAKSLIVVDLGVDEGDRSTTDGNTSSLRQHSTECSGKLPSMGRWENVPGKVQIWLQSHFLPNMEDHTSVPGNFPQRDDRRMFREMFKSGSNLTSCQTWEITRQFQETSRNGAMEDFSRKGLNLVPISPQALDCRGFGC